MAQLQPYVSNVPLFVAKNLRFDDDNGIPVTQMLPVGMNGTVVNDTPRTGYISRIGAVLSDYIDLYAQVNQTLTQYGQDIATLQQEVADLQTSGTTVPNVNGFCFTGDAQTPITTVVELMAESACDYNTVFGTSSALMEAILAEGASTLNVAPAFSQASAMAGLQGWDSDPETVAATINNLWLSYLDARAALQKTIDIITPSCSQAIIDFATHFVPGAGSTSGIFVYFSGYSFIPNVYEDDGSIITITDTTGGIYTTGVDMIARSQPGADPLFVQISGTPLAPDSPYFTVTLSSNIVSDTNSCTKVVIHTTEISGGGAVGAATYRAGNFSSGSWSGVVTVAAGLPWVATYANIVATNSDSAAILQQGYFIEIVPETGDINVTFTAGSGSNLELKWVAFK